MSILALAVVALIAAVSSVICSHLDIPVWTMFIGWIAFVAGGMTLKSAAPSYVSTLLGVALGFIGAIIISKSAAILGSDIALLLGVFVIVFAALLSQGMPFANLVVCYFIGMTTFFASGLAPALSTAVLLLSGLFVGVASGLFAVTISARMTTSSE